MSVATAFAGCFLASGMTRKRGEGGKAGMRHAMGSATLEFIDRILCVKEIHCMARALGLPEGERLAVGWLLGLG